MSVASEELLDIKPEHNRFDNIFSIRRDGFPSTKQLEDHVNFIHSLPAVTIGRARFHGSVCGFLRRMTKKYVTDLEQIVTSTSHTPIIPMTKIVIPELTELKSDGGAIYYCIHSKDGSTDIFRGTYGYNGAGPHESALVEANADKLGLALEVRSGDFLLQCFMRDQ